MDRDTLGDEQGEGSAMVVDESHKTSVQLARILEIT